MQMAYSTLDLSKLGKCSSTYQVVYGLAPRPAPAFDHFPADYLPHRWLTVQIRDKRILPRFFLRSAAQTRIGFPLLPYQTTSSAACEITIPFALSRGVIQVSRLRPSQRPDM